MQQITRTNNDSDLHVDWDGYEFRRVAGQWQQLGASGEWFNNDLPHHLARHVADFEAVLRCYTFDEGPAYPKGRRSSETVDAFIRRLQIAELREGSKNIFAPVKTTYDASAENRARYNREHGPAALRRNCEGLRKYLTVIEPRMTEPFKPEPVEPVEHVDNTPAWKRHPAFCEGVFA